jgi:hypothetical protein
VVFYGCEIWYLTLREAIGKGLSEESVEENIRTERGIK